MERISKTEVKEKVEKFFKNIKGKTPKEIKKMKKLAMKYNISLGDRRKLFCKECFVAFNPKNHKVRIKKGKKVIICGGCSYVTRWKTK